MMEEEAAAAAEEENLELITGMEPAEKTKTDTKKWIHNILMGVRTVEQDRGKARIVSANSTNFERRAVE